MTIAVPSYYQLFVGIAAQQTGLPYQVVAAQAYVESGFNANAVSPAGAEGWLQFLPSTFAEYGSGSPFNVNDEMHAYINFMRVLINWAGGNVRIALAAYNAGQGNWQAGLGYADEILRLASEPTTTYVGGTHSTVPAAAGGPPSAQPDDWSPWVWDVAFQLEKMATLGSIYNQALGRLF